MLVSHDFRLIGQVAKEIWVVADGTVKRWEGDIQGYKAFLKGESKGQGHFTKTK
jgi:ATP-binding cassette subfamily F protein 2